MLECNAHTVLKDVHDVLYCLKGGIELSTAVMSGCSMAMVQFVNEGRCG